MSLSGIFDPVVRTYFKRHFGVGGSSGGATEENFALGIMSPSVDFVVGNRIEWSAAGAPMYKRSDKTPTAEELDGGYYYQNGTGIKLSIADGTIIDMSGDGIPGMSLLYTADQEPLAVCIPENAVEMMAAPEPGFYISDKGMGVMPVLVYQKEVST